MAPKRHSKVVGSVVKTKVVQETVEVTTAFVADDDDGPPPDQQAAAPGVEEHPAGVNVSGGSTVVHVEVTTPDGDTSADVNVKRQQKPKKRGRGGGKAAAAKEDGRQGEKTPDPVPANDGQDETPVSLQSQETQDPNEDVAAEEEEEEDASAKKKTQRQEAADEDQPKTPRVASERKTTTTKVDEDQQQRAGGSSADGAGKKNKQQRRPRRRRLGAASPGGDAGMGGVGGYKRYVWRVLKQVHPELGMSGRAMQVLDMMMADMFERLAGEAARLSKVTGRVTLTSREVQSAVRLVLPGELGKHAISEGVKAINKYMDA